MTEALWMALGPMAAGFALDLLLGDPHWMYHPVRLIGGWIAWQEEQLRKKPGSHERELAQGRVLVCTTLAVTALTVGVLLWLSSNMPVPAQFVIRTLLCYWLYAVRSLRDESMKVYRCLKDGDLEGARHAVSMIVGRDTQRLSEEGVIKAAVETVAESTSDGVIAPLFYMALGGPFLGWLYKAVNTMDSMVGYKNEKYLYFGRCAAKLDDVVNFIPARLAGHLMIFSCRLSGADAAEAKRIYRRDRHNHASPNSAHTESVMAGALHVQLAGDAWYFGQLYEKPTIGDPTRAVETEDIVRANRLMTVTSCAGLVLALAVRCLIIVLWWQVK